MDLDEFINEFGSTACIISIEMKPDGSYGKICIETGNKAYLSTFEQKNMREKQ